MSEKNSPNLEDEGIEMASKGEDRVKEDAQETLFSGRGQMIGRRSRGGRGKGYRQVSGEGRRFRYRTDSSGDSCVCPSCNHIVKHEFGQPCYEQRCPVCGVRMMRQ